MSNSFMDSAKKAKLEQEKIQRLDHETEEALKAINILIPAKLHYAMQLHRVQTGENMTQLIRRLLSEELM